MLKKLVAFVVSCVLGSTVFAQLLTTIPNFPKDNSAISIIVDCSKGNQGLFNYANTNDIYVHVGVITNLSSSPADWKYVKFTWGTTDPAAHANLIASNKYQFDIANIRSFFGVPANETILRIAILFRNGSGSQVQRNADGGDMYVKIYDNNPAAKFLSPPFEPKYNPVA